MTKILVIEDVHYLRNDVLEMLKFEGFDVRGAENGRVGVELAREYLPDLIICDIMMPEMDGFAVLDTLRNEKPTETIPFIFLTAKTDRVDWRTGMGKGADDYVTKPFMTSELLDTIRAQLKKVERNDESARRIADAVATQKVKELQDAIAMALPHELRTPLNTVIGFSEMLMMEAQRVQPSDIYEWSQHINSAAHRLHRLVENYLFYIRIETALRDSERLAAVRARITDNPLTAIELQAITRAQQARRENDLQLRHDASAPVYFTETDLAKMVDELLENAFKFSVAPSPVVLETHLTDTHFVITVTDQGRGMTQDQIDAIDAFIQFERYLYEQQGTGLGLTVARGLARLHDTPLEISSVIEQGTTITVRLRRADI